MTGPRRIADAVAAFFAVYQEKTVIGIKLPTGWFGKPYDNYYTLVSTAVDDASGTLDLDLSYGWRLELKPVSARLSADRYELVVAVETGTMTAQNLVQRFGAGDVVFSVIESEFANAALRDSGERLDPYVS